MCAEGYIGVNKGNEGGTTTVTSWHEHTVVALADKAATCTEAGYTGRTYCEVCNSVVDWGTTVPATGHNYEVADGVLKCSECGDLFTGKWTDGKEYKDGILVRNYILVDGIYYTYENGVQGGVYTGLVQVEVDDKWGYSKLGSLTGGWVMIDDEWYYFDTTTLTCVETYNNGKVTFEFEENGKVVSGQWYFDGTGNKYYYGPDYYHGYFKSGYVFFVTIDGKTYNFDGDGHRTEGGIVALRQSTSRKPTLYRFDVDGSLLGVANDGIVFASSGDIYYVVNGDATYAGLVQDSEGNYYYISGYTDTALKNCTRYITYTNGLLPAGMYTFGADGKLVMRQGIVHDDDGEIRYYVNDKPVYAGLVQDSDGNYYYISGNTNTAIKNRSAYITYTNGLLPAGTYTFDADGKLILKQGVVLDADGEIRYYVDNKPVYAGLVQDSEGNYYYISGNTNTAIKNRSAYITYTNGLLPAGTYTFDADGKLILKQGVVLDADGEIRYYVDNKPVYAGLVQDSEGNYYYISGNTNTALKNCTRYITYTNGLLPAGTYTFGADGRIIFD